MELGAGIPASWLEVLTKAALPSLKVGQTLLIPPGDQEEWGGDRTSLEGSAKSSYQPVKVLALGGGGFSGVEGKC